MKLDREQELFEEMAKIADESQKLILRHRRLLEDYAELRKELLDLWEMRIHGGS
jgi:hypothetical protein